jgi:hypothetical protein
VYVGNPILSVFSLSESLLISNSEYVCWDSYDQWNHINCQGIDGKMYKILDESNLSWNCINCGMPNFSTTFFNMIVFVFLVSTIMDVVEMLDLYVSCY